MATIVFVVVNEFTKKAKQVTFAERDDVIEELSPAGAYKPLGNAVLPRASDRRDLGLKPRVSNGLGDETPKLGVAPRRLDVQTRRGLHSEHVRLDI